MPKEKIIPYADKQCIGNRALYQLSTRSAGRVHWDNPTDARAHAAASLRSSGCFARRVPLEEITFPYAEDRNCRIDHSSEDSALDDSYYAIYSIE